jgi:putative ABC transport system permease protein
MRSLRFALVTTVRQPARTLLGVLGVAAVGALLFDMLLLSRGLVVSFQDLLDRVGFDVRVLATDAMPLTGPRLPGAASLVAAIGRLPEVEAVVPVVIADAAVVAADGREALVTLIGAERDGRPMWSLVEGADLAAAGGPEPPLVVSRHATEVLDVEPGRLLRIRGLCGASTAVPLVTMRVAGVGAFPFDAAGQLTMVTDLEAVRQACGGTTVDEADLLLVASAPDAGADRAAAAIRALRPDLHVFTNAEVVERFRRVEFSYFRQISTVLAAVTLVFGFLLIAVLLTVSVNQRLGEITMLRALGLSRARVVGGVLWESALLVGIGGVLAVPLGAALSVWLDAILHGMPGVPLEVQFFAFEARALVLHAALLGLTAVAAALYPMRLVSRLPIAATLRREVVS